MAADAANTQENRVRRLAARRSLALRKWRPRAPRATGGVQLRLLDILTLAVVAGPFATLAEVEKWLDGIPLTPQRRWGGWKSSTP